jgi:hypothetical protein
MSVYKYMGAAGGLRLLDSLELRITPPSEFNDPFELRPPVGALITAEQLDSQIVKGAPAAAIEELANRLAEGLGGALGESEIQELASSLIFPLEKSAQKRLVSKLARRIPQFSAPKLLRLQRSAQEMFPTLLTQARAAIAEQVPTVNAMLKRNVFDVLPSKLGVLCFSRSDKDALMWAHYGDSHKGLLIEFDENALTFNRRQGGDDDLGFLRPVTYSKVRPELNIHALDADQVFETFALTKAEQWKYEEEVRLILPLQRADRTVATPKGVISLLTCPAAAIRSVTLGCKASDDTLAAVRDVVRSRSEMSHVSIRKARLPDIAFELIYDEVSTPAQWPRTDTVFAPDAGGQTK